MSRTRLDLTGQTFGRLKVVAEDEPVYNKKQRISRWVCVCSCGTKVTVRMNNLRKGITRSCGCFKLDMMRTARHTHRQTHDLWCSMLSRCNNKNNYSYRNYGGRGIKVCKRWYIFENFLADMGDKPAGLSLDRKNNNGNYTKLNCRWATQDEQSFNRRNNRYLKFGSETLTVTEWKRKTGLSYDQILQRFHNKKGLT